MTDGPRPSPAEARDAAAPDAIQRPYGRVDTIMWLMGVSLLVVVAGGTLIAIFYGLGATTEADELHPFLVATLPLIGALCGFTLAFYFANSRLQLRNEGDRLTHLRAENDPQPPPSERAAGGPGISTLEANPPSGSITGQIMIARDPPYLRTDYGNIKLEGDVTQEVKWLAELAREGSSAERSVERPSGLLWNALMTRESGACAWFLGDPRRVKLVCANLAAECDGLPGGRCDVVVALARGGVIIGYELARQLGASLAVVQKKVATIDQKEVTTFELWDGFECDKGSRIVVVDDTVTTGETMKGCILHVSKNIGNVVAAACLVDRSSLGGKIDNKPLVAFWRKSS